VQGYEDPFYDNHALYKFVGVFQHDTIEAIRKTRQERFDQMFPVKGQSDPVYGRGNFICMTLADEKFFDGSSKAKYDTDGDPIIGINSFTRTGDDPDFYKDHLLYGVVGAQRDDDHISMLKAIKLLAYRVLQYKHKYPAVHSEKVEAWYRACQAFCSGFREKYDELGDVGWNQFLRRPAKSSRKS